MQKTLCDRVMTLVAAVTWLAASPARADRAEAQDLAARAQQRDALGDHQGAIELLEHAFQAEARPEYLRDTAAQYVALTSTAEPDPRDLRLAVAFYRQYLLTAHNPPDASGVQEQVAALEKRLALAPDVTRVVRNPVVEAVDIRFITTRVGASYRVSTEGKSCETPCTLSLKPGTARLTVTGGTTWQIELLIPPTPGLVRLEPNPHDLVLTGSLLVAGGVLIGGSLWSLAAGCSEALASYPGCVASQLVLWPVVGGLTMLSGIAVLSYYGAHPPQKTYVETADAEPPRGPGFRFAFAGVQPLRNGLGTSIGFEF
jgi:hypothetical protein